MKFEASDGARDDTGHSAWLVGCPSREVATRYRLEEIRAAAGPELQAKHRIPLFWLACFDVADALTTHEPDDTQAANPDRDFTVLCAPASEVVARLRRRRVAVLGLIPARFAGLYDEWIAFIESCYPQHLLLRTEDLFSMDGYERCSELLLVNLRALEPADRAEAIADREVFTWFSALHGSFDLREAGEDAAGAAVRWRRTLSGDDTRFPDPRWPPPPATEEVVATAALAEAVPPTSNDPGDAPSTAPVSRSDKIHRMLIGSTAIMSAVGLGALGVLGLVLGAIIVWGGMVGTNPNWKFVGLGVLLLGLSAWVLRSAGRAARVLVGQLRAM
jgi:hypothetical protein